MPGYMKGQQHERSCGLKAKIPEVLQPATGRIAGRRVFIFHFVDIFSEFLHDRQVLKFI